MKIFILFIFFYLLSIIFKNLFFQKKSNNKESNVIDAEFEEVE
jgi:regulatory protein YycI of two-component signal transduction system YycFG